MNKLSRRGHSHSGLSTLLGPTWNEANMHSEKNLLKQTPKSVQEVSSLKPVGTTSRYAVLVWTHIQVLHTFRDAILPSFSGFPDFSSVQCENEI